LSIATSADVVEGNSMINKLKRAKYFRWYDSGDIQTPLEAFRIFLVMQETPHVKHWLPTRS